MIKIGIAGIQGRMGQSLLSCALSNKQVVVTAATLNPNKSPTKIESLNIQAHNDLAKIIHDFDVLIDFTNPEATIHHLNICSEFGKKIVIGTTGLDEKQKKAIESASGSLAIVFSPNMSIGMNLTYALLRQAAQVLGNDADIEIIETHHRNKKDAPSGTALRMGEEISKTLGQNLKDMAVYDRQPLKEARKPNTIGFSSIRAGDVVGVHTALFAQEGETLEITHRAHSRANFAIGAIRAAIWLAGKDKGLFDMQDVLFK